MFCADFQVHIYQFLIVKRSINMGWFLWIQFLSPDLKKGRGSCWFWINWKYTGENKLFIILQRNFEKCVDVSLKNSTDKQFLIYLVFDFKLVMCLNSSFSVEENKS